jgi:hypothetical protein
MNVILWKRVVRGVEGDYWASRMKPENSVLRADEAGLVVQSVDPGGSRDRPFPVSRSSVELPTLWYENETGERFVPDVRLAGDDVPAGFIYQHSRFPLHVQHSVLRAVIQSEVDACRHPDTKPDFGIVNSMDGRECLHCHGYQSKQKGEPWPEKWQANGARQIIAGSSSANDELVTMLVRNGMSASEAISRAAAACERCMNIMAQDAGLSWGYSLNSPEAEKANTSCELCRGTEA